MVTRQELGNYLDQFLQTSLFHDSSVNGLQVQGKPEIKAIGFAVSASLEAIEKAAILGMDALIVHHGLFWSHDPYPIVGTKLRKLEVLLKNELSLFAYHLPLDAHLEVGNNWKAARDLGWDQLRPFGLYHGQMIGVCGTFEPKPRDLFQRELEAYYQHPAHSAPGGKEVVASAALISGGAYRSLLEAAGEGIDCFITGNFDEPAWNQAFEERTNFFALGHAATEKVGPKALAEHLKATFNLNVTFIDHPNPF